MKLTVIGMWGAYPKAGGASSGYLLETERTKLLIDCGSGVLSRLSEICNPTKLDGVILSHYHADHFCDIPVLMHARYDSGLYEEEAVKPLPIYCHANSPEFQSLSYRNGSITQGIEYRPGEPFQIGDFTITPVRTIHPLECYGFRICAESKVFFYTADGAYGPHLHAAADKPDFLLCESNMMHSEVERAMDRHMTGVLAGKFAEEIGAKRMLVTHLPPLKDNQATLAEVKTQYHGPVELAYCGQILTI